MVGIPASGLATDTGEKLLTPCLAASSQPSENLLLAVDCNLIPTRNSSAAAFRSLSFSFLTRVESLNASRQC